eukprot:2912694-Lingulodinium_polyedra.AAC.1
MGRSVGKGGVGGTEDAPASGKVIARLGCIRPFATPGAGWGCRGIFEHVARPCLQDGSRMFL